MNELYVALSLGDPRAQVPLRELIVSHLPLVPVKDDGSGQLLDGFFVSPVQGEMRDI